MCEEEKFNEDYMDFSEIDPDYSIEEDDYIEDNNNDDDYDLGPMNYEVRLHIKRSTDQFNKPTSYMYYDYVWSRIDLNNDTIEILRAGSRLSISKIVDVIDWFENTEEEVKKAINTLLDKGEYESSIRV